MKFPGTADSLYRLAEYTEERMMQQGAPERGDPTLLRTLAAMSEVFRAMPRVVCLIGSTRFFEDFAEENLKWTLAGFIVLSIGCDTKKDGDLNYSEEQKDRLDLLHMWKIILADEVRCLNRDQYIGKSTARELGFATLLGRPISYLESPRRGQYILDYAFPDGIQQALALAASIGAHRGT